MDASNLLFYSAAGIPPLFISAKYAVSVPCGDFFDIQESSFMKRRSFLALLPSLYLAHGCGSSPFYFVQLADTQIGFLKNEPVDQISYLETPILEAVIDGINRMTPSPAFVVVCGDMTNTAGDDSQLAEYKRLMGRLKMEIPCYVVSGNHDFAGNPTPETIAQYRTFHGQDRYMFDRGDWRFIALNSTLVKFPVGAREEADAQLAWAKETLATARDMRGAVVFMHHPFFDKDIEEEDSYNTITKADRRMWLDLFAENNVKAVFSGHRHTTIPVREYGGMRLINTNAVCNSFDNTPGFRTVRLIDDLVDDRFWGNGDIPEKLELWLNDRPMYQDS